MNTLTGKTRYREKRRLFRSSLLVLQVEERHQGHHTYSTGFSVESDPYDFTDWRDAKPIDIINNRHLDLQIA